MEPILMIFLGILLFFLILMGIFIFYYRHDIYSFFKPIRYFYIYLLHPSGMIESWLHFRKDMSETTFEIDTETYFFPDKKEVTYFTNKIPSYFYLKGEPFPKNLYNTKTNQAIDTRVLTSFKNTSISDMFLNEKSVFEDFWSKYGLFVVIFGFIALLLMLK